MFYAKLYLDDEVLFQDEDINELIKKSYKYVKKNTDTTITITDYSDSKFYTGKPFDDFLGMVNYEVEYQSSIVLIDYYNDTQMGRFPINIDKTLEQLLEETINKIGVGEVQDMGYKQYVQKHNELSWYKIFEKNFEECRKIFNKLTVDPNQLEIPFDESKMITSIKEFKEYKKKLNENYDYSSEIKQYFFSNKEDDIRSKDVKFLINTEDDGSTEYHNRLMAILDNFYGSTAFDYDEINDPTFIDHLLNILKEEIIPSLKKSDNIKKYYLTFEEKEKIKHKMTEWLLEGYDEGQLQMAHEYYNDTEDNLSYIVELFLGNNEVDETDYYDMNDDVIEYYISLMATVINHIGYYNF